MTPEQTKTAARMTAAKADWDKTPPGPKKDRALKHFWAAEKALEANDDDVTNRELDSVKAVLA